MIDSCLNQVCQTVECSEISQVLKKQIVKPVCFQSRRLCSYHPVANYNESHLYIITVKKWWFRSDILKVLISVSLTSVEEVGEVKVTF